MTNIQPPNSITAGYNMAFPPNHPHPHRRPKYKTPKEMEAKIEEYFKSCEEPKEYSWVSKRGEQQQALVTPLPDWTGLALHLGFASRQSLNDYINRKKSGNETQGIDLPDKNSLSFAYILIRAKSRIEEAKKVGAELGLYNDRMITLDLSCNHGYIQKQQHEIGNIDDNELKVSFVGSDADKTDK